MKVDEQILCRVCGSTAKHPEYTAKEMMFGMRDTFTYFQCTECDCLQIKQFPENLSKYYPNETYHSFQKFSGSKYKSISWRWKKYLLTQYILKKQGWVRSLIKKSRFHFLYPVPINKDSTILDVGCGIGEHYLYPLKEMGFANVMGIDPFIEKPIEYSNGLTVKKQKLVEINQHWDLIMFHHSYEHVPNPLEVLQKVSSILQLEGICIIRIPVADSYAWEHYGINWVQLDAPRHLFLHTVKSIKILAEKSNLNLIKVTHDSSSFQFLGSELYLKDIPLVDKKKPPLLQRKLEQRKYARLSKDLNKKGEGDQAIFYLQKPST